MAAYRTENGLKSHKELCYTADGVREELYVDKDTGELLPIGFKNHRHSMRVPLFYTFDFEYKTTKVEGPEENSMEQKERDKGSYTKKYQRHDPTGYVIRRVSIYPHIIRNKTFHRTMQSPDDDIKLYFYKEIEEDAKFVTNTYLRFPKPMLPMTPDEVEDYTDSTNCHICNGQLGDDKVRDHCHVTGKYRGTTHSNCNTNYRLPKVFPVFCHNMSKYDAHLFIRSMALEEGEIQTIPETEKKYISFSKSFKAYSFTKNGKKIAENKEIRFLDSIRFMQFSLDKLVGEFGKGQ